MRRGLAAVVAALSLAMLAAGCGGDKKDSASDAFTPGGGDTTSATPSPSPSSTVRHAGGPVVMKGVSDPRPTHRAIQQAWVDFYAAYADAVAIPDPGLADWTSRMTPAVYQQLRPGVGQLQASGQTQKGQIVLRPAVGVVRAGNAVLSDCVDVRGVVTYDSKGNKVPAQPGRVLPISATLQRSGDRWQVSRLSSGSPNRCK